MDERYTILAVDDEYINTQVIKAAFRDEYDILTAKDGDEAISLLKQNKVDLILLDVMMPGLSGFEVCKIIRLDPEYDTIPVIFLTALDSLDDQLQGLELGGIDYLTKPVNIALLKLRVRNHLMMKEQRDQLEAALARVKRLEGIIPICSYCKQIRDDQQSWHKLERYISDHSEALFTHSICPHCYDEQMKKIKAVKKR